MENLRDEFMKLFNQLDEYCKQLVGNENNQASAVMEFAKTLSHEEQCRINVLLKVRNGIAHGAEGVEVTPACVKEVEKLLVMAQAELNKRK